MAVGDDHDLIIRTYLARYKFAHTGSCGYLYRDHPGNTVKKANNKIQKQQADNRDRYFYSLIDEWVRRHKLKFVALQPHRRKNFITESGELKLGAKDSSIGVIRAFDFLQFVAHEKIQQAMEEIHRVLIPGGWLCCSMPSTLGQAAFAPHYRSFWNEHTFNYFTDNRYAADSGVSRPKARFQRVRCWTMYPSGDHKRAREQHVYADLCAIKGQRQPGAVRI